MIKDHEFKILLGILVSVNKYEQKLKGRHNAREVLKDRNEKNGRSLGVRQPAK